MSNMPGYSLPPSGIKKLEGLVNQIVANPGRLIDVKQLADAPSELDIRNVIASLPEGITEEDFVGMLKLAMLTESATDSYAAVFLAGAKAYNATWLTRFNEEVWVPDEHTHMVPYQHMLRSLGFTDEELNREIRETKERHYEHCCGVTPIELTVYGTIQEFLTDHWHGLLGSLLKEAAPAAARSANLVKRRETLHTVWYRDMSALQVEENPELIAYVGKSLATFQMPGTTLVPAYGPHSMRWMQTLNVDFDHIAKELVRNFAETAGSVKRSGMLLVEMAVARGYKLGPFQPGFAQAAMNRLGGPGYGLIGEAILEKVGLPVPRSFKGQQDRATHFYSGVFERIRSKMRSYVAERIDVRAITGDTSIKA